MSMTLTLVRNHDTLVDGDQLPGVATQHSTVCDQGRISYLTSNYILQLPNKLSVCPHPMSWFGQTFSQDYYRILHYKF